jgi:hypothetical protein
MIPRRLAVLCLTVALAGCDDPEISNVLRRVILMSAGPPVLTADTVMLVEIHGVPWAGATPEQIAGTIKMPEGPARTARFVAVAPGESLIGGAERLVLQFNPPGELDSAAICHATGPLDTRTPRGSGFTLHAVYCRETEWLIQARMETGAAANDWLAYHLAMERLLGRLFEAK